MDLFWSILIGVLAAPLAGVLGLLLAYGLLKFRGISEYQGRRGLLAFVQGFLPGSIIGMIAVARFVWWLRRGEPDSLAQFLGAVLLALIVGLSCGFVGWVYGIKLAEKRRVTNYAGERAAWGFIRVAFPTLVATSLGGFWIGTLLFG